MTTTVSGDWTVTHDFAFVYAGAERVTRLLAQEVVPSAPLVTLLGREPVLRAMSSAGASVVLPRVLATANLYRALVPFYPAALRRLAPVAGNLLASSYAFSHHIRATGRKVVYCHSPLRQIWSGSDAYLTQMRQHQRALAPAVFSYLRRQDRAAARGADAYIAASPGVAERIERYYGFRPVATIQPPVEGHYLGHPLTPKEDHYLWVGRITEPYKRLAPVIEAFDHLEARLIVVGDGPDRARLQGRAGPNVEFVGWQTGVELGRLYRSARALVFPSEDDFGIVPLEAMASGTAVLAFGSGGATGTVVDGKTGLFFQEQTSSAIRDAVQRSSRISWDAEAIRRHAEHFDEDNFVKSVQEVLESLT